MAHALSVYLAPQVLADLLPVAYGDLFRGVELEATLIHRLVHGSRGNVVVIGNRSSSGLIVQTSAQALTERSDRVG
jgi:hypothetical protein